MATVKRQVTDGDRGLIRDLERSFDLMIGIGTVVTCSIFKFQYDVIVLIRI